MGSFSTERPAKILHQMFSEQRIYTYSVMKETVPPAMTITFQTSQKVLQMKAPLPAKLSL